MIRFSTITGLALIGSVAWFSAGQSLEKRIGRSGTLPQQSEPILEQHETFMPGIRFKTAELSEGSGTLNIKAGGDTYLIVSSTDPEAPTVQLALAREAGKTLATHRWEDGIASVRDVSKTDSTGPSLSRLEAVEIPRNLRKNTSTKTPKSFFIHVTDGLLDDPRQYATIHSRVIQESENVRVLLDKQEPTGERIDALAQRICSELEETILPRCTQAFGLWRDVDGDGKLTILLSPWLEKLQGGKTSLKGFVRGTDFDERIPAPLGNRCDVIYLNSNLPATVNLRTLLGHEFFHVLQCSLRGIQPGRFPIEEDWLSEAEAHLAEQWLQGDDSNLKHRIDAFLNSPGTAPLVVKDYYRAGLWRDDSCRGATFLFLQWCADRGGEDFLRRLLKSPESGIRGLETIMGQNFTELHRDWTISMLSRAIAADERSIPAADLNPSVTSCLTHESIPWTQLELVSLPESNDELHFPLAPSSVRFFKISASDVETCLRVDTDSQASLRLTLINSGQLKLLNSAHEKARLQKIATGLEKVNQSVR